MEDRLEEEALLYYGQATLQDDPAETWTHVRWFDVMRSQQTSDYALRREESPHGFRPERSEDPGRAQNQEFSTASDPPEEQTCVTQPPSAALSFYTDPLHAPRLTPPWPVLLPPVASVPHQNPFCPMYTPPGHCNPIVACGDSGFSWLVPRPLMSVYPACPAPLLPPNPQPAQASSPVVCGRVPTDALDSYGLWRRLCDTAKAFSSGSPDTEALACFFIRRILSLAVLRPDLPFTAAVIAAVEEWRKTPASEREPYHVTARMFVELDEQNKHTYRADEDQSISARTDKPTGNVKKTSERSKKAVQERTVQDLAERAQREYSQIMDALESKVSDGSEVAAADEEDVCALYLNQMFNHCEFFTESDFDPDFISSLLSTDHNLTDVLKENSQDMFSSTFPEPVAGCSAWTHATVSDGQILPSFAPQCDVGTDLQDHMTQDVFRMSTPPALVRLPDNDDQNRNKKQKKGCRRQKQALDDRTTPKSDRQRRTKNTTKEQSQQTDGRRQSLRQHDGRIRRENWDGELRRQRAIKTDRSHKERRRTAEAERNRGETSEKQKLQKLVIGKNGDGFQITRQQRNTGRGPNSLRTTNRDV